MSDADHNHGDVMVKLAELQAEVRSLRSSVDAMTPILHAWSGGQQKLANMESQILDSRGHHKAHFHRFSELEHRLSRSESRIAAIVSVASAIVVAVQLFVPPGVLLAGGGP